MLVLEKKTLSDALKDTNGDFFWAFDKKSSYFDGIEFLCGALF
jgi:hypothetical protein